MRRLFAAVVAILIAQASVQATATPVNPNSWYAFQFGGAGTQLTSAGPFVTLPTNPAGVPAPATPWTFTLGAAGTLTVLDLWRSVDRFELFNFGTSLGQTSAPVSGASCGSDITCALADARYSRGDFNLAPGSYSISGTQTAGDPGSSAFMVSAAVVPLPASLLLLLSALGLTGGAARLLRRA